MAERIYRQILSLDAKQADSLHLLGMIASTRDDHITAVELIRQAIAINKHEAMYHSNLGNILKKLEKLDEAIQSFRRALALKPDFVDAHNNLGIALLAQGKVAEAIVHYQRALALDPGCATALCNMGLAHEAQGKLTEAVECHRRALEMQPEFVMALYNLGNALKAQDRLQEALECFDRALVLQPGFDLAHFAKALTQLLQEDFAAGWVEYEWRWKTKKQQMRCCSQPLWNGEPLPSGRLLLWGEQGLGDEVMFAGLIPDVLRSGASCVLDCQARLRPLFERSFPSVPLLQHSDLPVSAHLPTGSLPRLFRADRGSFRLTKSPYLVADPQQRNQFRARYADGRRLVGVAWFTNNKETGRSRTIPLEMLTPLLQREDLKCVSLQYGDHATAGAPMLFDRSVDQMTDVDRFAAQIAALDIVITIDNSTAHLAGALGVPVWVLLPFVPDWRWFRKREDSPWYPSMRLFRQSRPGDWHNVIESVLAAL